MWQRPHHVISRLARSFRRTLVVEEPKPAAVSEARMLRTRTADVERLVLEVPSSEAWLPFGEPAGVDHAGAIVAAAGGLCEPVVWIYSPMALPAARELKPHLLVYDVMDDLASFKGAPPHMKLRHAQALAEADVVFSGGRSLHEGVLQRRRRPGPTVCIPSGVDAAHFAHPPLPHQRPVAGYVGVIDERLDYDLIAQVADRLRDWTIRMVGPTIKVDEAVLPRRANIEYWGRRAYADLPQVMAGFDVAIMPFAHNEATKSISPTKTLEFQAAGLPVVSTAIRDVVRDHHDTVLVADKAEDFARACQAARGFLTPALRALIAERLAQSSWDAIAQRMLSVLPVAAAGESASEAGQGA